MSHDHTNMNAASINRALNGARTGRLRAIQMFFDRTRPPRSNTMSKRIS
ncbi:MAG: hypothetical protein AAF724_15455 [Pseudomonadota bacterium]